MRFLSPLFWFSMVFFVLNQLAERMGFIIPYLHAYLDDVLAGPIVLGFALFIQQQYTYRNPHYRFAWGHVAFYVFWYFVIFELYLPSQSSKHTRDWWDLLAYLLGGLLFFLWGNRPARALLKR